jgi:hypothetical protein
MIGNFKMNRTARGGEPGTFGGADDSSSKIGFCNSKCTTLNDFPLNSLVKSRLCSGPELNCNEDALRFSRNLPTTWAESKLAEMAAIG